MKKLYLIGGTIGGGKTAVCQHVERGVRTSDVIDRSIANAVSLPLGLNFGWPGEMNLQDTLDKLFEEPFGSGYPKKDAERKN